MEIMHKLYSWWLGSGLLVISIHLILAEQTVRPSESEFQQLMESNLQFTMGMFQGISSRISPQENIIFSPFSVYTVLLMGHLGAKGHTAQEICLALKFCTLNISYIHDTFGNIIHDLFLDPSHHGLLAVANRIFIKNHLEISPMYEFTLRYYYNATVQELDFMNDAGEAQDAINDWVKKQTNGLIQDILTEAPEPRTSVVLANALYFSGEWLWRFDPAMSNPSGKFYLTDESHIIIPMMVGKMNLAYGYSEQFQTSMLELPYKIRRVSMFLVLPDEIGGLQHLQSKLNATVLKHLIKTMKKTEVNVRLPRFRIEDTPKITEVLKDMGLHDLFSSSDANLSGIASNEPENERLHVTDIVHRAAIKIDEKGSVAVAATAAIVERVGSFNMPFFEADHPFLFLIMDKQTGTVLFMGRISGP
ncbi:leukocyte elastase inhibitor-like [Limulus polyphemus]|uniref:Leukocyte elastase inhibitor-like n=1 Tax=Limulus polyphemus TaxID=6850 RepID=A0ABM1BQZ7_LIMPO|nr:leukocyte elastase inhibitor-like [Limulus polyphemus]